VAQLLRLAGCRVLGVEPLASRAAQARSCGLEEAVLPDRTDPAAAVAEWTGGIGADAVVFCAAGGGAGLLNRSLDLCRRRGRFVLVGDVPIRIHRARLYQREIDFLISTSSGPGRYDPRYEAQGLDYPLAHVRWTEGRNLAETVRMLATGVLRVLDLVALTRPVDEAPAAYAALRSPGRPIAALLDYGVPDHPGTPITGVVPRQGRVPGGAPITVGLIGAGAFARSVHLPNLRRHGGFVVTRVVTRSGLSAHDVAARFQIPSASTDPADVLTDGTIAAVIIATRHDSHAALALAALGAGKHVLVDKPLGLTTADCAEVVRAAAGARSVLAVGFNRRFAPLARAARAALAEVRAPKTVLYRINAGPLPLDHWLRDAREGGGRLLGEGVHFFDFVRWLVGADPVMLRAAAVDRGAAGGLDLDSVATTVTYGDGSLATVLYAGHGHPGFPKERVEVFAGGQAMVLDDFSRLEVRGPAGRVRQRSTGDKGHAALLDHFHRAVTGAVQLEVTAVDGFWATWCAEAADRSLRTGRPEAAP
jgi:predicted dehydrogenase